MTNKTSRNGSREESGTTAPAKSHKSKNFNIVEVRYANSEESRLNPHTTRTSSHNGQTSLKTGIPQKQDTEENNTTRYDHHNQSKGS